MVFHLFFSFPDFFVFSAVMKITKMTKLYPKICLHGKQNLFIFIFYIPMCSNFPIDIFNMDALKFSIESYEKF